MLQQEKLLNKLKNNLPHNLIIVGPKYSGKKTLINELVSNYYWIEGKVEYIRQIADKGGDIVLADVDNWSAACFSAMLKILEDNEHHMIITCKNIQNLPESIKSRCIIEKMESYSNIGHYCESIGQIQVISAYADNMIKSIDKLEYLDEYDLDVYFTVLCNRLLERVKNGENLKKEYLISSKFNSIKSLKSLNKKQFISNWQLCMKGLSDDWKRL